MPHPHPTSRRPGETTPGAETPSTQPHVHPDHGSGNDPAIPDRAEVLPGVWRLPLPLRDSPLNHVNTYLVRSADGYLLVDCGWDTADTLQALEGHLRALDIRFGDLRHLVVTHIHPDHYGLAGRLREIANANLSFHRLERLWVESRYGEVDALLLEMREMLRQHGTPEAELSHLSRASMNILNRVQIAYPDRTLDGGEEITCGRFAFRVIWTPGHSTGHICLYDAAHKILLSGDHVLPRITPSITMHTRATTNPLADYLDSLRLVRELQAELVLPGHGTPFAGLPDRVDELIAHHQARLAEILRLLAQPEPGPGNTQTAYQLAERMRWSRTRRWDDLSNFERRLAVTETLAHLELLHARGQLAKRFAEGSTVGYYLADQPS